MEGLFSLKDKTAIVTGGMGQLGIAFSTALVQAGAQVVIFDITHKRKINDPVFEEAVKNEKIVYIETDITNKKQIEKSTATVVHDFGSIDVLINNAAIDSPPDASREEVGPFETYPECSFDRVMDVNVKGAFLCSQAVGAHMAKNNGGSIINISSIYGLLSPQQNIYEYRRKNKDTFFKPVAYSVSKSAILNLTRYLATYWAKDTIRVNTLTLAGVFNQQDKEFLKEYCKRVPIGRMAEPGDYIGAIIYLASDASKYMTGSNMIVDGGWTAW